MGRLDEQAKNRIVVLRKAGLSFRKIKKVLELDNIKVTPQAIYLFLKRKNIEPEKSAVVNQDLAPKTKPWEEGQLWNLIQENGGQHNGNKERTDVGQRVGEMVGARRPQEIRQEEDIKIVSVTSLSKGNENFHSSPSVQRIAPQGPNQPETRAVRPVQPPSINGPRLTAMLPVSALNYHGRARTPLPAVKNPALLVTKKIVDRAIHLQKKVISQNGTPLLPHSTHYPLTATNTTLASRTPTMRPMAPPPCSRIRDASTQTAPAVPSHDASAEQLDSIRKEVHRLTQALQTLMDRQSRWEQEQHRQRQCNHQEVMLQIQQLGANITARSAQNCISYNNTQDAETPLPDIGHFKMELL